MKKNLLISIFLLFLTFINKTAIAENNKQLPPEIIAKITNLINKEIKSSGNIGVSVAIADKDSVLWAKGFSYNTSPKKIPATSDTVYEIGSISKLFTDMAILQLQEKGAINIDDPVYKYLPELKIKNDFNSQTIITPKNIMTHHAGLPTDI